MVEVTSGTFPGYIGGTVSVNLIFTGDASEASQAPTYIVGYNSPIDVGDPLNWSIDGTFYQGIYEGYYLNGGTEDPLVYPVVAKTTTFSDKRLQQPIPLFRRPTTKVRSPATSAGRTS